MSLVKTKKSSVDYCWLIGAKDAYLGKPKRDQASMSRLEYEAYCSGFEGMSNQIDSQNTEKKTSRKRRVKTVKKKKIVKKLKEKNDNK